MLGAEWRTIQLKLTDLVADPDLQSRVEFSVWWADELMEMEKAGACLPPVEAYHDGQTYWLVDGFHRYEGRRRAGQKYLEARVRPGSRSAAILYSTSCNQLASLPRTREDRHRAVVMVLDLIEAGELDPKEWSNRRIAAHVGEPTSEHMVRGIRHEREAARAKTHCDPVAADKTTPKKPPDPRVVEKITRLRRKVKRGAQKLGRTEDDVIAERQEADLDRPPDRGEPPEIRDASDRALDYMVEKVFAIKHFLPRLSPAKRRMVQAAWRIFLAVLESARATG